MPRLFLICFVLLCLTRSAAYGQCTLMGQIDSLHPVRCAGDSTGALFVSVVGGTPPLSFFLNGSAQSIMAQDLIGTLPGGSQALIISDADGCQDTLAFTIPAPDTLRVQIFSQHIRCNGDDTGKAWMAATGGSPPLSLDWQSCAGAALGQSDTLFNLFAGCYLLIATDHNGCTATDSVVIAEPPPFQFNLLQDSVNCFGGTDGSATVQASGATPPYRFRWDNLQTSPTATGLPAGFHSVVVTDTLGCEAATLVELLQPSALLLDTVWVTAVQCFGQSNGTVTALMQAGSGTAPYRYDWGNGPSPNPNRSGLAAGTYTVTITDEHLCSLTASVTVSEPLALQAGATQIKAEICAGDCQGEAAIAASGGTEPYDFLWDKPSILPGTSMPKHLCPGQYSVTVSDMRGCTRLVKFSIQPGVPLDFRFDRIGPSCAGKSDGRILSDITGGKPPYRYRWDNGDTTAHLSGLPCGKYVLTLTDAVGCVQVTSVELTCPPPLQIQSILPLAVHCYGGHDGSAELMANGGTGTLTYRWSDSEGQIAMKADSLMAGIYTVTVSDANGCTITGSAEVTQPPELVLSVSSIAATCLGGNDGSAIASAVGGTLGKTFFWSNLLSGPQISGLSSGQYTVTATDAIGCTDTMSVWVSQPADSLRIQINQLRIACFQASNGVVEAVASGGNGGPFTYLWGNGAATPLLQNLPKTDLSLTVADSKGCTRTAFFQTREYDPVVFNVISSTPTCYGYADAKAILNKIKGGVAVDTTGRYDLFSYAWSYPGAPDSDTLLFVPAGNYTVTATDSLGCSGTKEFVIKDPQRMLIQLEKKDVICFGQNNGAAKVLSAVGLYPIVGYAWSNGTNGSNNPNLPPGTHTITLTDTRGCRQADSVQVLEPPPLAIAFTASELKCSGDQTATIQADITGGVPGYTLHWNTGATSNMLTRMGAGIYVLEVTDQNSCTFQESVSIARPDSLLAELEVLDVRCYGQSNGRLHLLVAGGQAPYRYSLNGSDFKGSSVFTGLQAGVYTLYVRDGKGCTLSLSATVQQPPPVEVSLGADTTIVLRDSLLLTAQVMGAMGMVEYAWQSAWQDTLRCVQPDSCAAVWVRPVYLNTYTVRATDEKGCFGEAHIRVEVEKPRGIFVPTAFTPNADGANDRLSVFGKSAQVKRILRFQVYDRWGELLFEDADFFVNDPDRGWDGQYRGQPCDPGTYIWYAEAEYWDGYRETASGGTVLLR